MTLHETQSVVARDNHDYRVVCCGRQWGKTTLAVWEMLVCAYAGGGKKIIYYATTIDQARDIAWAALKEATKTIWYKAPNETRLELYIKAKDGQMSEIFLDGFENIETSRGKQFDFIVIDEVAYLKNWDYAWQQVLSPTLTFRKGKALFISTPQGYNHFYIMFTKGEKDNQYWKSWQFTSYKNPYLPVEKIEQAKSESTEDAFATEYLADFRKFSGLAHKQWNRAIHLIKPFDVPKEWQRARGFDFGSTDGTASVRCAIDADWNWFLESCYLDNKLSTEEHARAIRSVDYELGSNVFIAMYGDPTAAQWYNDMERFGLFIQPASKEIKQGMRGWVENCVERVNELLMPNVGRTVRLPDGRVIEDAPNLFVFDTPGNQKFVKQIENLKWRTTAAGDNLPLLDETNDPTGFHYDLMAAMRYLAVSFKPTLKYTPDKNDISRGNWSLDMNAVEIGSSNAIDPWALENRL